MSWKFWCQIKRETNNGLSQKHILSKSDRNGHEMKRILCVFKCVVSLGSVRGNRKILMGNNCSVILLFCLLIQVSSSLSSWSKAKNCVLLAPIACPSWLPRNLSDTAKLTEKCALSETLSNTAKHYQTRQDIIGKTDKHYWRNTEKNSELCTWRHIVVGHSSQTLLPKMLAESRLWGLLMATSRLKLAAMADNIIQQCSIYLCGCDWYRWEIWKGARKLWMPIRFDGHKCIEVAGWRWHMFAAAGCSA